MRLKDLNVGDSYESNNYGRFVINEIINSKNIAIEFPDTGYKKVVTIRCVNTGMIKDPLKPSVYGVGIKGDKLPSQVKGKMIRSYRIWKEALRRCYDTKHLERYPTYKGCTVCDRWLNYENFYNDLPKLEGYKSWLKDDPLDRYSLDKDMLSSSTKIYSPETCKFVPVGDNTRYAVCKNK